MVRDGAWGRVSLRSEAVSLGARRFRDTNVLARFDAAPSTEHRLWVSGQLDAATVQNGDEVAQQGGVLGAGRWRWIWFPEWALESGIFTQELRLHDHRRLRVGAQTHLSGAIDAGPGTHELSAGARFDRVHTRLFGRRPAAFGSAVPRDARIDQLGLFVRDLWKVWRNVSVVGGLRTDVTLGRAYLSPQVYGIWDPTGVERAKVVLGVARRFGHLGSPALLADRERGLSRLDEASALGEWEIVDALAVYGLAQLRERRGVPTVAGDRVGRTVVTAEVGFRKVRSQRWELWAEYRRAWALAQPRAPLLDDSGLIRFGHEIQAGGRWSLPLDPWATVLAGSVVWRAQPLGTVVPDPLTGGIPNQPQLGATVQVSQPIDLRRGRLWLDLHGATLRLPDDDRTLAQWVGAQPAELNLGSAWAGPRVHVGIRYAH